MATETADSLLPNWISSQLPNLLERPKSAEGTWSGLGEDTDTTVVGLTDSEPSAAAATTVSPVSEEPAPFSSSPPFFPLRAWPSGREVRILDDWRLLDLTMTVGSRATPGAFPPEGDGARHVVMTPVGLRD